MYLPFVARSAFALLACHLPPITFYPAVFIPWSTVFSLCYATTNFMIADWI